MNANSPSTRYTLRDLPLPAKLVVTTFLISVGFGYLWAMAQIHFKHASHGSPMPTTEDIVSRFSGVPWPLEPKPEGWPKKKIDDAGANAIAFKKPGIKIKTIVDNRCIRCHKPGGEKGEVPLTAFDEIAKTLKPNRTHAKGRFYSQLMGKREDWENNMVAAFFEQSADWDKLSADEKKAEEPKRESERLALIAWVDAGFPKEAYESDRFPLPANLKVAQVSSRLLVEMDAEAGAANGGAEKVVKEKTAEERWDDAKGRQINVEHLTQSTHAHLLTFSMLWALTGLTFAFTGYAYRLRCMLAPLTLMAQIVDVSCWWLARLDGIGPYFAVMIVATGGVVGLSLALQITLGLFSMYEKKGRLLLAVLFLVGAGLFGVTYVKVIAPQLQAEKDEAAQRAK